MFKSIRFVYYGYVTFLLYRFLTFIFLFSFIVIICTFKIQNELLRYWEYSYRYFLEIYNSYLKIFRFPLMIFRYNFPLWMYTLIINIDFFAINLYLILIVLRFLCWVFPRNVDLYLKYSCNLLNAEFESV